MMVNKVVDNNKSKTLSKVKMHSEFIYVLYSGCNGLEHSDSVVPLQTHANLHGAKSDHRCRHILKNPRFSVFTPL